MSLKNSCQMWVFRDGRSTVAGRLLVDGLRSALHALRSNRGASRDRLLDALLRAGELECALADAASLEVPRAAAVTDALARALVGLAEQPSAVEEIYAMLEGISAPASVSVSPPEGFSYYALHPLDFADLADAVSPRPAAAAVVGIRSIGTTLSAVLTAALARHGTRAERITVRPVGHPYARQTALTQAQTRWIAGRRASRADFLVVDEGPGISGSSFLSVGDALLQAGVERERITFLGSRYTDPDTLAAADGAARWRAFRSLVTAPTPRTPADRGAYLGSGDWRHMWLGDEPQWPACWVQMERLKFLSRDGRRLYKFDGLGRFGQAVAERARLLGELGFGPRLLSHMEGFSEYEVIDGRPMHALQISSAVLARVADYCALRAVEFGIHSPRESQLDSMVRFNIGEEFGPDAAALAETLTCTRPVIADGRMLPHEWVARTDGTMIKTDGATHGDDHFFPGPVDVAWDLAGAIIEWGMTAEAARYLLDRYRLRSGDDAGPRLNGYMLAYSVFRMAFCEMAAFSMRGWAEEARLRRAALHYRALVEAQLKAPGFRASGRRNVEWPQRSGAAEGVLRAGDGDTDSR